MSARRPLAAAGLCLLLCWLAAGASQQPRRRSSLVELLAAGRHSSAKRAFERRLAVLEAAPVRHTWRPRPSAAADQQPFERSSRASSRQQTYDVPIIGKYT